MRSELETLRARNEAALDTLKKSAGWDSSRPFTQEEARGYHSAMVMAMAFLSGDLDDFAQRAIERFERIVCRASVGEECVAPHCPCAAGGAEGDTP